MPSIRFQFHSEPSEMLMLAESWARQHELHVAFERFFPEYTCVAVPEAELKATARTLGTVDRIVLGLKPLDTSADSTVDMATRNPHALLLLIGRLADGSLRESSITAGRTDDETTTVWQSIVRRARSQMHKGARVQNPVTGDEAMMPSHRHTEGAHELAARGLRMLSVGGDNEFVFDDLDKT